jgi:hypothetical protein
LPPLWLLAVEVLLACTSSGGGIVLTTPISSTRMSAEGQTYTCVCYQCIHLQVSCFPEV